MPDPEEQKADLIVLEELFLDQLTFKVSSLFDFLKLSPEHEVEIESFLDELVSLSSKTRRMLEESGRAGTK